MAIINQVVSGGGSPTPSGKYQLLQRVKDDNNNEIGTVCGFHTDANDVEYAVVCLDATYRLASGQVISSSYGNLSSMTSYNNSDAYGAKETATDNCDKILAACVAGGYTSSAISHCRTQSFVIDGTTYYGQLPTIMELIEIFEFRININNADTTAVSNPTLIISNQLNFLASTKYDSSYVWCAGYTSNKGFAGFVTWTSNSFVAPVLELPNA